MKRVHLIISGLVQGVFFRANTKQKADALKLFGWVKNIPTGKVEVYAIGNQKDLEAFVEWCHQGPSRARVAKVKVMWDEDLGNFSSFEVI